MERRIERNESPGGLYEPVLTFWFGHIPGQQLNARQSAAIISRLPYWAGKWGSLIRDVDGEMRAQFTDMLEKAAQGEFEHWLSEPTSLLAWLLLLDQFPRNMYRGTPTAFSHDQKTLPVALKAIEEKIDQQFFPVARSFLYLPLVHQEELRYQDMAVVAYRQAVHAARGVQKAILLAEYASSLRHREAIQRFGRFPHRNAILGRETTQEEATFLRQPFTRF
ncbi:MAG: DUF924 domain-containing protein [Candidatus Sericytochromatia bacterium]|nr:DUF924 domain-containing protein [Candidatus Sericytochromatia bacterium]